MKKYYLIILFLILVTSGNSQTVTSIINELKNTFQNYEVSNNTGNGFHSNKNVVSISYVEPVITIQFISESNPSDGKIVYETKLKFDVLKSNFYNASSSFYLNAKYIEIRCSSGIEIQERRLYVPRYGSRASDDKNNRLVDEYLLFADKPVLSRLENGFNSLKAIANEKGIKKSSPNILDDADIFVKSISFISPDESGKLKASQTGCIKVEIENNDRIDAYNLSCIVNEKNKTEMFSFDQYNPIEKILGNTTKSINIPIKVSEQVDNNNPLAELI